MPHRGDCGGGSDATRHAIIIAAARLFERDGYAGTSVSAISREAGVTSGAVYFHFAGKPSLARTVIEEQFAVWPELLARVDRLPAPALSRIIVLSFEVARAFRDDLVVRSGSRLWIERRAIGGALPPLLVGWVEVLTGMVRAAVDDGSADAGVDPAAAADMLVCGFVGACTVSDGLDDRDRLEQRVAAMWRMLLPALRRDGDAADLVRGALAGPD